MSNKPTKPGHDPQDEEWVQADDAVIARAWRRSALILALVVAVVAIVVVVVNRKPAPPPDHVTPLSAPVAPERLGAEAPKARFTDITAQAGINFVHRNGAAGEKLLPETMGGGVAFFDYDNDGDEDLLFVNGKPWPWSKPASGSEAERPTQTLYQNDGTGKFKDATPGSGLDVSLYGMGAAVGDYDNDGKVDVLISGVGGNGLFKNLGGGKFSNQSAAAGVRGATNDWSTACAWVDFDRDGDLDLFVGHYIRWSKEIDFEMGFKIDGINRAYGQPMNFEGTFPSLYRNEGNGRFTDVSQTCGMEIRNPSTGQPMAKTLGVAPVDLDGDGWMDLVVANDTVQNFAFHNQTNGTFKEIGALTGLAFDNNGQTRGAMGIDAARYRNDDALGIAIGNFANEMTALYVSQKTPLLFTDEAIPEGVGPASRLLLKFGLFFFDYDLDGRLDLLTANGHLEQEIAKLQKSQTYAQPAQLFWNCGAQRGASFVAMAEAQAGPDLFKPIVGRGSAFADIDGDGDLDVVLTQAGGAPLLLRNDQALEHRWIRLKLVGRASNRDAIGAWVRVRLGSTWLSRQVMPTRGYLSQSELPVTIGLGRAEKADALEIRWPNGKVQAVDGVKVNALTVVEEAP